MKVIKQNAEQIRETKPLKKIELIARTCYKSENLIKDGSDVKFVQGLIKAKHYAMLEHAIYHFETNNSRLNTYFPIADDIFKQFAKVTIDEIQKKALITMNLRNIIELLDLSVHSEYKQQFREFKNLMCFILPKEILDVFQLVKSDIGMSDITLVTNEYIKQNYVEVVYKKHCYKTFKLTTNRAIANELVRHRLCSFAQESTRYCNYSKDKFSNEIKVIEPCRQIKENQRLYNVWKTSIRQSELDYFNLLDNGATTDTARGVLPMDLATELIVTANLDEWEHIFDLRMRNATGKAHPQCKEVIEKVYNLF